MDKSLMTRQGYKALLEKFRLLKEEKLPSAEERLGKAREMGDLSENAEFDAAREEIWQLDRQIAELESQLSRIEVVDVSKVPHDAIYFGATVTAEDTETKKSENWTIVGNGESDINQNLISIDTPLASAFIGHKKGDTVEANLPAGRRIYKVLGIEYKE